MSISEYASEYHDRSGAKALSDAAADLSDDDLPIDFDPYDFDWFVGRVKRTLRADTVAAEFENGMPAFFAKRDRRLLRQVGAVSAGLLSFPVMSIVLGGLSGVFSTSQVPTMNMIVFLVGLVVVGFLSWLLAMRLMPDRPIIVHADLDPERADLVLTPTRRYRLGRMTLRVVEPAHGTIGFLMKEDGTKFGWTATYPGGDPMFKVQARIGARPELIVLSLLIPPLGWLLMLYRVGRGGDKALAVVSADARYRFGSIRPAGGLGGDLVADMSSDPQRYADRRMVLGTAVAMTIHG